MTRASTTDDADLLAGLRRAGVSDVDDSGLARALYSTDASLYRVLPRAVVRPRHADEVIATLAPTSRPTPRSTCPRCCAR